MLDYKKFIAEGLLLFLIIGCTSNPPSKNSSAVSKNISFLYKEEQKFSNLDTEFATYIVQGELGIVMRKSINILAIESSQEVKDVTIYWRDMAMLFLGVEAEEKSVLLINSNSKDLHWRKLPTKLQFALITKLIQELNNYIKKDDEAKNKQTEISKLRHDLRTLTQKQQKLEQLLDDLEKVK